ncbi:HET-domain-containing protein [Ophiobolus disseminans]|uniref:HET-domain-containing protein n=1 Tax=Ophiobolus disseminans TaxID=1469910 RepID=A0A6A7A6N5_9PLEO|nr:HET-domain-containing protein [Ophiobolus disseminans]
MGLIPVDKRTDVFCAICNCLGFFHKRDHDKLCRPGLIVLANRSFDEFSKSAKQGCCFCDVVQQSFLLLQYVDAEMRVKLLLYAQSPAELHASANKDVHEVVEIYSCSINTRHNYPILGNDVPKVPSFDASMKFLRENYYTCRTDHEECCHPEHTYLPKRVVDISKARYRVHEPAAHTMGVYATLSYSWGSKGFAMTTSGNYEEMKNGFDRDTLPIAFQDAAAMVQGLGISYIWIDTLCIVQDDGADWEEQAAKMGQIFEGAAITIAASLSTDPYHTLFTAREPSYQEAELYSEIKGEPLNVTFKARRKITRGIHAKIGRSTDVDPLDKRAWGLQEKLLSRRLIAFTGAELQWTCRTLKACECHHNSYPSQPLFLTPTGPTTPDDIVKLSKIWSQIIEEYSARELRFLSDKLPALGGLASKFGAVTEWTYIAGGWRESILFDLVWQRDLEPIVLTATWHGPSFSWASSPGAVNFRFARHSYPGSRVGHSKVIEYKNARNDVDCRALDCLLVVQGHTVAALLRRSPHDFQAYTICIDGTAYSRNTDQRATCEFSIDASILQYSANQIAEDSEQWSRRTIDEASDQSLEQPITLLSLYSIHHRRYLYHNFLILEKSHDDVDSYRRIGVGSGKMYRANRCENDFPSEPQLVRPFEWLSCDFERSGRRFADIVEQVLHIR